VYATISQEIIDIVRQLRTEGKTYSEIRNRINLQVPKSTLSEWCKHTVLPENYRASIDELNIQNLGKARATAVMMNKVKREKFFENIRKINEPLSQKIHEGDTAKIALSMLCLGEASKSKSKGGSFVLGNSDPRIIVLFLELLKVCFQFDIEKVRCTVQCRADQDESKLKEYWQQVTQIPVKYFYKSRIDPRTIGKPTLREGYQGVLRVDYFDKKVQLELESLADLVYNQVSLGP
jgi:hypothetical protein